MFIRNKLDKLSYIHWNTIQSLQRITSVYMCTDEVQKTVLHKQPNNETSYIRICTVSYYFKILSRDSLIHQRADSRSKKNYSPAACGMKTTFTER